MNETQLKIVNLQFKCYQQCLIEIKGAKDVSKHHKKKFKKDVIKKMNKLIKLVMS